MSSCDINTPQVVEFINSDDFGSTDFSEEGSRNTWPDQEDRLRYEGEILDPSTFSCDSFAISGMECVDKKCGIFNLEKECHCDDSRIKPAYTTEYTLDGSEYRAPIAFDTETPSDARPRKATALTGASVCDPGSIISKLKFEDRYAEYMVPVCRRPKIYDTKESEYFYTRWFREGTGQVSCSGGDGYTSYPEEEAYTPPTGNYEAYAAVGVQTKDNHGEQRRLVCARLNRKPDDSEVVILHNNVTVAGKFVWKLEGSNIAETTWTRKRITEQQEIVDSVSSHLVSVGAGVTVGSEAGVEVGPFSAGSSIEMSTSFAYEYFDQTAVKKLSYSYNELEESCSVPAGTCERICDTNKFRLYTCYLDVTFSSPAPRFNSGTVSLKDCEHYCVCGFNEPFGPCSTYNNIDNCVLNSLKDIVRNPERIPEDSFCENDQPIGADERCTELMNSIDFQIRAEDGTALRDGDNTDYCGVNSAKRSKYLNIFGCSNIDGEDQNDCYNPVDCKPIECSYVSTGEGSLASEDNLRHMIEEGDFDVEPATEISDSETLFVLLTRDRYCNQLSESNETETLSTNEEIIEFINESDPSLIEVASFSISSEASPEELARPIMLYIDSISGFIDYDDDGSVIPKSDSCKITVTDVAKYKDRWLVSLIRKRRVTSTQRLSEKLYENDFDTFLRSFGLEEDISEITETQNSFEIAVFALASLVVLLLVSAVVLYCRSGKKGYSKTNEECTSVELANKI